MKTSTRTEKNVKVRNKRTKEHKRSTDKEAAIVDRLSQVGHRAMKITQIRQQIKG